MVVAVVWLVGIYLWLIVSQRGPACRWLTENENRYVMIPEFPGLVEGDQCHKIYISVLAAHLQKSG